MAHTCHSQTAKLTQVQSGQVCGAVTHADALGPLTTQEGPDVWVSREDNGHLKPQR